jgi:hypothetical protein
VEEGRLRGEAQATPPAEGLEVDDVDNRHGGARRSRETAFAVPEGEETRVLSNSAYTERRRYDDGGHPYDEPDGPASFSRP